jgi:hypothetical protein
MLSVVRNYYSDIEFCLMRCYRILVNGEKIGGKDDYA